MNDIQILGYRELSYKSRIIFNRGYWCLSISKKQKNPFWDIKPLEWDHEGAGGTNDISARIVDSQLQEILRVPVIHINKPGGGGVTGTAFVKEQKPDGYTILWGVV